ncbi:MAG: hypothetical protein U0798_17370 [Gemmataceae bacterium]
MIKNQQDDFFKLDIRIVAHVTFTQKIAFWHLISARMPNPTRFAMNLALLSCKFKVAITFHTRTQRPPDTEFVFQTAGRGGRIWSLGL